MGLGTWLRTGDEGLKAILAGIEIGYRHLDTAQTYDTEQVVGRAIRQCGLPRSELFVTTKVADANLSRDRFRPSLEASRQRLGVDQIDLTLIHWPSHRDAVPLADYMSSLAEAMASGLTRLIGVSNFTIPLIEKSVALLGPGAISTNQVELHPYLQSRRLRAACERNGVTITAYMPLAEGKVSADPVLRRIAARHGATAAMVSLAWLLQNGMIVIPASSRREHMESNFRATSLRLAPKEMAEIDALDQNDRMIRPAKAPVWDDPP
jgi:2,5-diketo-D-gluconate reductase B